MQYIGRPNVAPMLQARRVTAALLGWTGLVAAVVGCGSIEPVAPAEGPITDPTQLYMRLELNHPAVVMSTADGYNTLQLIATPLDADGNPLSGLPTPTYRSSDTASVLVTADGLITAKQPTTDLTIIAELVVGPVRHADTTRIDVTTEANPPVLTTFAVSPDSAVWSSLYEDAYDYNGARYFSLGRELALISGILRADPKIVTVGRDADGNAMSLNQIEYRSLDPKIATVNRRSGKVDVHLSGQVRMVTRTTAYGVSKVDTFTYTITPPVSRTISVHRDLAGTPIFGWNDIVIPPYGIVTWTNYLQDTVDVTFDGPTDMVVPAAFCQWVTLLAAFGQLGPHSSCGTGNALLAPAVPIVNGPMPYLLEVHVRQFPTPGIYTYRSMRTGATGRIVVTGSD